MRYYISLFIGHYTEPMLTSTIYTVSGRVATNESHNLRAGNCYNGCIFAVALKPWNVNEINISLYRFNTQLRLYSKHSKADCASTLFDVNINRPYYTQ